MEAKLSANNDEIKSRTDSINNLENLIKNYKDQIQILKTNNVNFFPKNKLKQSFKYFVLE